MSCRRYGLFTLRTLASGSGRPYAIIQTRGVARMTGSKSVTAGLMRPPQPSHRSGRLPPVPSFCSLPPIGLDYIPTMTSSTPADPSQFRLPVNVKPTHYDLTVRTDLENQTFGGFVKIRCVITTDKIFLQ